MSSFFLDSSALVKRYLTETGSFWVQGIAASAAGNTIAVAEITRVEAAIACGGMTPCNWQQRWLPTRLFFKPGCPN